MTQKLLKNYQLTIIHVLLRNYYVFLNIYVVGQGDQRTIKLVKKALNPPHLVETFHAPPHTHLFRRRGSPAYSSSTPAHMIYDHTWSK